MSPVTSSVISSTMAASAGRFALEASITEFRYRHAPQPILSEVDLKVRSGEFVVIVGGAGSGKTTLCYCLAGIIPHFIQGAYRGAVRIGGRNIAELSLPAIATEVGFLFQRPENQLFNSTVAEEVAFGPENLRLSRAAVQDRVAKSLAQVGMNGFEKRRSDSLSGGEIQRVALASVLAMEPQLLILDQPTAELDPGGRKQLYEYLGQIIRSGGQTVVMVADYLEDALPFATRLVLLHEGQIVRDGPLDEAVLDDELFSSAFRVPVNAGRGRPKGIARREATVDSSENGEGRNHEDTKAPRNLGDPLCLGALVVGYPGAWFSSPMVAAGRRGNCCESKPVVLQTRELSFRYPNSSCWALRDVDITFRQGEIVAIIGGNGAGKTTLAKHFIGLLRPTIGQVMVGGRDARGFSTARLSDSVGYMFQNPDHQLFCDSVYEEVAFSLKVRKAPKEWIAERVGGMLEELGLSAIRDRHPYTLSGGQRQRLALASILVHKPAVLIVDEPTAALNWQDATEILELLALFNKDGGTVVIITHDLDAVARYTTRTVVMGSGEVKLDGPTSRPGENADRLAEVGVVLPDWW